MTTRPLPVWRKVRLGVEVVVAYARVRWCLWRRDFPEALRLIREVDAVAASDASDDRLARAVRATLRRLPADSRCLMQSLVLTRLLARRGRESRLIIGVSPGSAFGAHAWIERDDVALLPADELRYQRLAEL